jgi:hypothetical protein
MVEIKRGIKPLILLAAAPEPLAPHSSTKYPLADGQTLSNLLDLYLQQRQVATPRNRRHLISTFWMRVYLNLLDEGVLSDFTEAS